MTRCGPKSRRGRRWTAAELKSVGVRWLGDQLSDGDGFVGTVRSGDGGAVTIHLRCALEREGRVAWHYRGNWPLATLESIRQARDDAREAIKRGADPNATRVADRIEVRERIKTTLAADALRKAEDASVEDDARERLEAGVARKDGNVLLKRSLEKKVFPRIGAQPLRESSGTCATCCWRSPAAAPTAAPCACGTTCGRCSPGPRSISRGAGWSLNFAPDPLRWNDFRTTVTSWSQRPPIFHSSQC